MRRSLPALAVPLAGAAVVHALPALTARGPVRRLTPGLAGTGRAGGVALTFDDGPDPDGTPAVLDALARLGWHATFFLLGSQVRSHPETARRVVDAGHEIAVHGTVHRNHLARTPLGIRRDLRFATREITAATGVDPRWFRPPYGVLSAGTLWAARDVGLAPVLWTAWGKDWRAGPPDRIAADVMSTLRDRGTVLLHDSDCTSRPGSWRSTVAALPLLAEQLRIRDLEVRRLADHLAPRC
jgi:peptidoglycan/xylan/chitin deacetylase (PgdA/CDA1 family)